jgi:hypothetical protein
MRSILIAHASGVLFAMALARTAGASVCPAGEANLLGPSVGFETAQYESTVVEPGSDYVSATVACDLTLGSLSFLHAGLYPGSTWILARDFFDVTGVPAGTAVDVVAELVADGVIRPNGCGGSGCSAGATASIASEGAYQEDVEGGPSFAPPTIPIHLETQLPLTIVAGTPRLIEFKLQGGRAAGGSHDVEAAGVYRFVNVPAGVTVVSCRGLAASPTPALPASWGKVKAAYR